MSKWPAHVSTHMHAPAHWPWMGRVSVGHTSYLLVDLECSVEVKHTN